VADPQTINFAQGEPEWLRFTEGWYLVIYAIFVLVLLRFSTALLGILDR
jgi:branched-chain amino acid transport system permease protein